MRGSIMKRIFIAFILLLPLTALAQKSPNQSALKEMVETEQAFSKTAEVKNARQAFMEFIADDGLLFRPGAVNGKKWMNEHPVPPSDKKPLLAWQPAFAGMAEAGDLGFTTGPWEAKADINDAKPGAYGHFVTLWKKQSDNSWKFVIDLGISHPESGGPLNVWKVEGAGGPKVIIAEDTAKLTESLIHRDRSFSVDGLKLGVAGAFRSYASEGVRLYIPNKLPFIGRDASVEALTPMKENVVWQPIAGDVSRSGDLGYTHGTYEKIGTNDPKKIVERGSYVHIWQKNKDEWQIVLQVTNITP
jgi:ketosteroid isomerase-like protein